MSDRDAGATTRALRDRAVRRGLTVAAGDSREAQMDIGTAIIIICVNILRELDNASPEVKRLSHDYQIVAAENLVWLRLAKSIDLGLRQQDTPITSDPTLADIDEVKSQHKVSTCDMPGCNDHAMEWRGGLWACQNPQHRRWVRLVADLAVYRKESR